MWQTTKIFNDPIHGHIELSKLSIKIVDTPQFQRLRDISQVGGTYYVFPGASSHRFEHCIGVAYLARSYVEQLRENQPELNITDIDVACVEIAGLCHDIGHGPFSHLYDGKFLPAIVHHHSFQHEYASVGIFDLLLEENKLHQSFYEAGFTDDDLHFIKELILGDISDAPPGFEWKGRGDKTFLYDIVANKINGIDVDKFDYFARDCWMLGLTKSFDSTRLMKFARVFPIHTSNSSSPRLSICFHVKEAWNIFELFHTRYTLHKRAYQHRVSNVIEMMLVEVLKLADDFIFIPGKDNAMRKMSECPNDYHAYWRLTEYILKVIENSVSEELRPAREMIYRIRRRDLFHFSGETIISAKLITELLGPKHQSENSIKQQLMATAHLQQVPPSETILTEDDLFCQIIQIGYGKGNLNPVSQSTTFYAPNKQFLEKESSSRSPEWKVGVVPEGK